MIYLIKRFQHNYRNKWITYYGNVNVNSTVENLTRTDIGIKIKVTASVKIQNSIVCAKNIIFGILLHVVVCKSGKCVGSIINDPVIMRDEIIEVTKAVSTNFNEKVVTCKTKTSMIYSRFYWLPQHYL